MSKLSKRKHKVVLETDCRYQGRELVIRCTPYLCYIREKGRRHEYSVSWEAVFMLAVKASL